MKVMTPHYYKDFRCIAGACTDTCCAGGMSMLIRILTNIIKQLKVLLKRLKSVMVPSRTENVHLH